MTKKQIILRLLALLALIIISYLLAGLLAAAWLPQNAARLILGIPLLALLLPLAYWLLYRHYRYTAELPYFLLPPDFLLPLAALAGAVLVFLFVTPRFAIWQWGAQGTGTVQALAIEERDDPDLGTTIHFRVDYTFENPDGRFASHTSYISETLFDSLQPEDPLTVHYLPWWPQQVTAGDPTLFGWQAAVLTWGTLTAFLWLLGAAIASKRRYAPAPPPPFPPPQTARDLLQRYDLDTLLTDDDDVELWAALLNKQFPVPEAADLHTAGLRFALGCFAPEARLKMQPITAVCFTRIDEHHLQRAACTPDEQNDADIDPELSSTVPMLLLYLNKVNREKRPLRTILLPRPSANAQRLPVYTAICHSNGNASGETAYWQRQPDGRWQHSGEKLNWWMDSA